MPQPYVHELRVRYSECDPQGVVFNANYLERLLCPEAKSSRGIFSQGAGTSSAGA